jgi:membrane protease subunit HflK
MPWTNQGGGGGGPWGSGGGRGPWGSGPQSSGPKPPDLEEMLRRGQDRLRRFLPGGSMGSRGFLLLAVAAIALWGLSGFFKVEPDELGVVLRFGKEVREVQPGLNYHLPYPIETALTPKALRVNKIDIGMREIGNGRGGTTEREVPEESLMLTGDENIVDVNFSVFWKVKPTGVGDYLFNIQHPAGTVKAVAESAMREVPEESLMLTGDENIVDVNFSVFWKVKPTGVGDYLFNIQHPAGTVKAVAESAMREVIGRSDIQPILTGARQVTETAVQDLMQKTLNSYGAGIDITQVQLQKVDPPKQVIDAFRDVQAARIDLDRSVNEAQTYANRVIPQARGNVAKIIQAAEAYRRQTVAEATGESARFDKIYQQYKKAPAVTRERMYLETMERVLGNTSKIIVDSKAGGQGVVPYLPLDELAKPGNKAAPIRSGGRQ